MPISQVVVNASPLIALFNSRQAELLPQLFEDIIIPRGVWEEVTVRTPADLAAQQLKETSWVQRVETVQISAKIAAWDLGQGESEVLSWIVRYPNYTGIVDDLAARRCADALAVNVIGTGAMLILAKRRGLIQNVTPGLQALKNAGLYISDKLMQLLQQQAGE